MNKVLVFTLLTFSIVVTLLCGAAAENFYKAGSPSYSLVDSEVLVVADNQFAFDYGSVIDEQQYAFNRATPTARRNAISNLFSLDFLEDVISRSDAKLVIHAGDAMNNGCRSEFERFKTVMNRTGKPWFMAPGNHDVSYLGISHPKWGRKANSGNGDFKPLNSITGWGGLCFPMRYRNLHRNQVNKEQVSAHVFNKRNFIKEYLQVLRSRSKLDNQTAIFSSLTKHPRANVKNCRAATNIKFLHQICWLFADDGKNWNSQKTWRDFIVQEVRWRNSKTNKIVSAILIDTSQFSDRPRFVNGKKISSCSVRNLAACEVVGGVNASVLKNQRKIIEGWLKQNQDNNIPTVLVGHHPFRKLKNGKGRRFTYATNKSMVSWLNSLSKRFPEIASITAHTHDGYSLKPGNKKNEMAEYNVGSLVDIPLEAFRLNWAGSANGVRPRLSRIIYSRIPRRNPSHRGFYLKQRISRCEKQFKRVLGKIPASVIRPIKPSRSWSLLGKRNGLVSQLQSFEKEAEIFVKVLAKKGYTKLTKPVCFRTNVSTGNYNCGSQKQDKRCALAKHVVRCSSEDRKGSQFVNLSSISSNTEAIGLAKKLKVTLSKALRGKMIESKAYRLQRDAARLLHAIREFDESNRADTPGKYRSLKACLAQVAGFAQYKKKHWWR